MKQHIFIKNMVCERCKQSVTAQLAAMDIPLYKLTLGDVVIEEIDAKTYAALKANLHEKGFELIKSEDDILIEQVKTALIEVLDAPLEVYVNISEVLTKRISKDYSAISKLFSKTMGITIEKYFIQLKIEKVKELLQLGQLQFTEIAQVLGYTSSSHLAHQFKTITGMSMSTYKASEQWNRKTIDKII
ncbi:helix-turn-helix transcriptional regulator [uncultured Formosa sp.]|uniref:helix-turn-helix domain-containing protein n=1 Tax=uncultured Formosa sp. TaxID=255435 RepID=UPI00260B47C8|nr:helix-turn-helix transcriptional regulator [uncultured Formosa sp.]